MRHFLTDWYFARRGRRFVSRGLTLQIAVFDNFSDLNDTANPAWTHLDGLAASTGQTWSAASGQYRMTAPTMAFTNLGFVGSYVPQSFTNVTVSADHHQLSSMIP